MKYSKEYITIYGFHFLLSNHLHAFEYRISKISGLFVIDQSIHDEGMLEYLTEAKTIGQYNSMRQVIEKILSDLRRMEFENGLYKEISNKEFPLSLYSNKIEQWVDLIEGGYKHFFIHGNFMKYDRPSIELKEYSLSVYRNLIKQNQWQIPYQTDLWMEEIIKNEISSNNMSYFQSLSNYNLSLVDFLKKCYADYEDQIDRYLISSGHENTSIIVTPNNWLTIRNQFEHHLMPEYECE